MIQQQGTRKNEYVFVLFHSTTLKHLDVQQPPLPIMTFDIVAYAFTLLWDNPRQPLSKQLYKPHTTHNSSIRFEEGLTLETSAFESRYGG